VKGMQRRRFICTSLSWAELARKVGHVMEKVHASARRLHAH
jgi:hypothetical protein